MYARNLPLAGSSQTFCCDSINYCQRASPVRHTFVAILQPRPKRTTITLSQVQCSCVIGLTYSLECFCGDVGGPM